MDSSNSGTTSDSSDSTTNLPSDKNRSDSQTRACLSGICHGKNRTFKTESQRSLFNISFKNKIKGRAFCHTSLSISLCSIFLLYQGQTLFLSVSRETNKQTQFIQKPKIYLCLFEGTHLTPSLGQLFSPAAFSRNRDMVSVCAGPGWSGCVSWAKWFSCVVRRSLRWT